jgi:(4S)-4-hydroxy-5-phosphonooxypentane-2,3-dione isomerase
MLVEIYRDEDAAAEHKLTPHYATWRDAVAEMLARPRESVRSTAVFPSGRHGWESTTP